MKRTVALICICLATPVSLCLACLWDKDTLDMERRRFPSTLELITGKFLRHTSEYYQWRKKDREQRIAVGESSAALYDDLAVACEKTGRNDLAIETMLKAEELFPGRYETYANLGTFYIHSQQYDRGLEFINKALAINPDAHFGREEYQKLLVEYVLEHLQDGKLILPLGDREKQRNPFIPWYGFAKFILMRKGLQPVEFSDPDETAAAEQELARAVKGVLGMMRFGNHQSPVLLEALGDLLASGTSEENASRLAARAYLSAAAHAKSSESSDKYREFAELALARHLAETSKSKRVPLRTIELEFQRELTDARKWYAGIEADERRWIRSGVNPEAAFDQKYAPNDSE